MTADRLQVIAEYLRELGEWIEAERPGSIDVAIVAWCATICQQEFRSLTGDVR